MNNEQLYCYGMMLAEMARVEMMKAENMQMSYLGEPMKYQDHDFAGSVIALQQLALRALNG